MFLSKAYSWELSDYFTKRQRLVSISKQLFNSFLKKIWKILFTKNNIEVAWLATRIWLYNLNKILRIYTQRSSSTQVKKLYIRFAVKILLLYHTIDQLAQQERFNAKDIYIHTIFRGSE